MPFLHMIEPSNELVGVTILTILLRMKNIYNKYFHLNLDNPHENTFLSLNLSITTSIGTFAILKF